MNKQQLANRIWESANKMRSKIEANEYKDYILGFIFYKFLSDKEVKWLIGQGATEEEISALSEEDEETMKYIQGELGYFISYENLFSTWLEMGSDFGVSNVRDALSAFNRLISPKHKKVFEGIFATLDSGLSKLGESTAAQTKAINSLIHLIKDIPTDGRQGYDVLGFIYEYLISMFAANAGKKAGEFYTPHEVSQLMSEIVAGHLKDEKEISIYDPTSGSGSLLITIGQSVSKYIEDEKAIRYYAQELKANTYNLTRMNLVMRDIIPDNIVTRNGDTLEDDWPYFEENDPIGTYNPLYVDAVVSNPPYSQHWDPKGKENDARYRRFGVAPKTKADYAFLLHDLFHLKPSGIMTIVLPHGVLFRGGDEGQIRRNLIEENHVDAIIGLPANIFFGTGIPTIIMVLKQKRTKEDVLIIDASKGFAKEGKNNKLRASDIKKIVDTYFARADVPKYSRAVSRDEIRANDYNLNIPRYVDSSDEAEHWDISSLMFGGVPEVEVDGLSRFWNAFSSLRSDLFIPISDGYVSPASEDVRGLIENHSDVLQFSSAFDSAFADFGELLRKKLVDSWESVNVSKGEESLGDEIFSRISSLPLIDKYSAYEVLDGCWKTISEDLEVMQTEGFDSCRQVVPNLVMKKKDGKDVEVQDGWVGYVIPYELVQSTLLSDLADLVKQNNEHLSFLSEEISSVFESLTEEEREGEYLNEDKTAFSAPAVKKYLKDVYHQKKLLTWSQLSDCCVAESGVSYSKDSDELEDKLSRVHALFEEEKSTKSLLKLNQRVLDERTKEQIESLTDAEVSNLLYLKWIVPLCDGLQKLPKQLIAELVKGVSYLSEKYAVTFSDTEDEIAKAEKSLSALIDELEGSESDMKGLRKWQSLLSGE
ncbi:MAG: type I restriction-modification system subunit M [Methanocorpusculum sp.]|nr:type I restriction-modification system subunit M [Methanocorpusculum sp.]